MGTKPRALNAALAQKSGGVLKINDGGDPTRRRIYLYVRDHVGDDGVTTSMVATEVGVHPNVARHHLDKLAAGGYLEVAVERSEGAGAGRPAPRIVASVPATARPP